MGINETDLIDAELNIFGREGVVVVLGPVVGAFGEMSSHVDLPADVIADALTADSCTAVLRG